MTKKRYKYREVRKLMEFTCPNCGVTIQQSNDTGKVINIISTRMNEEEKEELRVRKAVLLVEHIENHLKEEGITSHEGKVICKICGKTIDEIYEEELDWEAEQQDKANLQKDMM